MMSTAARAEELGGSIAPIGPEGFGLAVLPPSGTYYLNYVQYYRAREFNGARGVELIPEFEVDALANVVRVLHVTEHKLLGADLAFQAFVPVVRLEASVAGTHQTRTGLGDITVSPVVLGWHGTRRHVVAALDVNIPSGRYDPQDIANIGRNHWSVEAVLAGTHLDPAGLEVSAKLMYNINFENGRGTVSPFNPAGSPYRGGNELHADFAVGWHFSRRFQAGLQGYYYRQVTDDRVRDTAADRVIRTAFDGFRGEALGLGPSFRYEWRGVQFIGQWQHELHTRYRPQGDRFWFRTIVRL